MFQGRDARSLFGDGTPGVLGEEGNLFRIALVECDAEIALTSVTYYGVSELKPTFAFCICDKLQNLNHISKKSHSSRVSSNLVFGSFIYKVGLG